MRRMLIGAVAAAALLASWMIAPSAHAVSCAGRSTQEYVAQADVVLVGGIQSVKRGSNFWFLEPQTEVKVERYLKGSGFEVIIVTASQITSQAGGWPERQLGQPGVFFLRHGEGGSYRYSTCDGSRWLYPPKPASFAAFLNEVEAITGPGSAPQPGRQQSDGPSIPLVLLGVGVTGLLVALGALGVVQVRRRSAGGQ